MPQQSILDYVDNRQVLEYARSLDPANYFFLSEVFRVNVVDELSYEYLKGASGNPAIMADVVAYESRAPIVPREGFELVTGRLPIIKQKSLVKEEELLKIFSPNSTKQRQLALNRMYDDLTNRVNGVYARLNWMAGQIMSSGLIVFNTDHAKFTVNFGVPGDQKYAVQTLWSNHTDSDPLKDIKTLQDLIKSRTGKMCDVAVTSNAVILDLLSNAKIKQAIAGAGQTFGILTLPVLNQYIQSVGLPMIIGYDEYVKSASADNTISSTRVFAENVFTMFPSTETIGETLLGPTAEGIVGVGAEEAPGIWAEVKQSSDPVQVSTIVVATGFQTAPGADLLGILTVRS